MTRSSPSADRPLGQELAHLRLLQRAAAAANQCAGLDEAGAVVLAEVCRFTGWPVGHLAVAGAGAGGAAGGDTWSVAGGDRAGALRAAAESSERAAGVAGRVLATARPAWSVDGSGPLAAFGFPIVVGDEVVAVLEFFAEDGVEPDDVLVELMTSVGQQLARVVERTRATEALRQSEARLRAVTESALDAIVTADPRGVIVSFNSAAERTFGYREDQVVGRPLTILMPRRFHAAHQAGVEHLAAGGAPKLVGTTAELQAVRRDGSEFPVELSLSTWQTAEGRFYTGIIRDVTERRQAEEDRVRYEQQLAQRALHDSLTALPNRALLTDRVEQAMVRASRTDTSVAVLSVNIDRFKNVNDRYCHHIGDELLVAAAGRLQGAMGPGDTVARIGGDEFAVLRDDLGQPDEALHLAQRVMAALSHPFVVDGIELHITATVGMAVEPVGQVAPKPDRLLRDAEVARERARRRGMGQIALYDSTMRADAAERRTVEQELRVAVRDGRLELHYQPIIDIDSGLMVGVEGLVRWQHPSRGLLLPQQFIGLAEDSGLIVPLGRWVLEEACRQGAAWQRDGNRPRDFRVSVNVSARQFQQPHWADEVAQALLASGFEPGRLVMEITESILMDDTDTTSHRLRELRDLGVRIAIDDFGTGYSSLGYLRRFPVDILKVDKSFIDGVAEGPHDSALARAVIKLASTLRLEAVAEGVTNRRQLVSLRRLRCRFAQGYYFSRPQPIAAIEALLDRREILRYRLDEDGDGVLEKAAAEVSALD